MSLFTKRALLQSSAEEVDGDRPYYADPVLLFWSAIIPSAWVGLSIFLKHRGFSKRTKRGSSEVDVICYEAICFCIISYLTYWGWAIWLGYDREIYRLQDGGPFANSDVVRNRLLIPMACFQFYNFLACVYITDFRNYLTWAHHLVTMIIACFSMSPCWQYYGVFFFGCTETSTLPLIVVELFKLVPRYRHMYPATNKTCRILFALSFLIVRLVYLPIVCLQFFVVVYNMLPEVGGYLFAAFIFYLIVDVFMVALQFYWGFGIFSFVMKSFSPPSEATSSGDSSGDEDEEAEVEKLIEIL